MPATTSFSRLPGFRDFPPEEMAVRRRIVAAWREAAARYGFREYDGPPLEPLGLYVEKSGPEIVEQLYEFEDKGGRRVALRPEMTPTLARILAERSRGLPKPIRWFSVPQLFRYERSQRGRLREHFQLNVDIVGEPGPAADAEVLAVAIDAVRGLGLTERDVVARVNDRRLVDAVLNALGAPPQARAGVLAAVDKAERAGADATRERLEVLGLAPETVAGVLDVVADASWDGLRRRFAHDSRVLDAMSPLEEHRSILSAMGLGEYVHFDFAVVRGLAYYTGIVFELFDRAGQFRAVCGGGRYDRLLELVGGEPLPAVGFGMGDVVLGEIMRERDLLPDARPSCDCYVAWVGDEQRALALDAARRLRQAGRSVLYSLRRQGMGKQLKAAARAGAAHVVIVGPDEAATGTATVRDMTTGRQQRRPLDALATGPGPAGQSEGAGQGPGAAQGAGSGAGDAQ